MTSRYYVLKLDNGRCVTWSGTDGPNAVSRYLDRHRDAVVIAYHIAGSERCGVSPCAGPATIE